jgi:hypothetical protein
MGAALLLLLCLLAVGCHVQPGTLPRIGGNAADAGAVAERLRTLTSAGTPSESHSANFIDDRQNAQKVYEAIQYAPAWVREGQATPQALAVISALAKQPTKGAQSRGLPSIALACATDCSQSRVWKRGCCGTI